MKSHGMSAGSVGMPVLPAWSAECAAWIAVACLVGALFLVRLGMAPAQAVPLANPLALALFVACYALIRIREAGGRL